MKKILTALFLFIFMVGGCSAMQERQIKEEVLLSEGYNGGCSYIIYNVENAPPLELIEHTLTYKLNDDGILLTSSPDHFGWDNKDVSPNLDRHYYYEKSNGQKIEIPLTSIHMEGNGSVGKEGNKDIRFRKFYLGTEDEKDKFEKESIHSCLDYNTIKEKMDNAKK